MPIQLGYVKLYSLEEIALFLKVSVVTLRQYIRRGILKGQKVGGQWCVTDENLEKFLRPEDANG
jgi:excisionase family DNA binding protein